MRRRDVDGGSLAAVAMLAVLALAAWALIGLTARAEGGAAPAPPAIPEMRVSEGADLAQQHRSHSVEAVEAGKLDLLGEPIDPPEGEPEPAGEPLGDEGAYDDFQPTSCSGSEGFAGKWWPDWQDATTTGDLLGWQGCAYGEDGTGYTFYNHDLGWGPLDIPGETFDESGVSRDGDGYIVVASSDHAKGTVIDTPFGEAKVYDTGCASGTVDIYTNR